MSDFDGRAQRPLLPPVRTRLREELHSQPLQVQQQQVSHLHAGTVRSPQKTVFVGRHLLEQFDSQLPKEIGFTCSEHRKKSKLAAGYFQQK